jgi:uncharacterized protein (TIGR03437 family)
MPPSLAGGIAPGSLFTIFGERLGPDETVRAPAVSLAPVLADVTIQVTQGGESVQALPLAVGATRVDALLPAGTPTGDAALTVSFQGRTSLPYRLRVVPSSFGIFDRRTAADFYPAAQPISTAPGETARLWGTGLGRAGAVIVLVGGRAAKRVHVAEAVCCRGIDEIAFETPPDAPEGCHVPVMVRSGDVSSNVTAATVERRGRACADPAELFFAGGGSGGSVVLFHADARIGMQRRSPVRLSFDAGYGTFFRGQPEQARPGLPPLGTCTVHAARMNLRALLMPAPSSVAQLALPAGLPEGEKLDAGPALRLRGPRGEASLDLTRRRSAATMLGGNPPVPRYEPRPLFLNAGTYTVEGTGGKDVGPFSAAMRIPRPIVWTNRASIQSVDRSKDLRLRWRTDGTDQLIAIAAISTDEITSAAGICLCLARARDRQFRIPAAYLSNLPATRSPADIGILAVGELPVHPLATFQARGLDAGAALYTSWSGRTVVYR